MLNEDTFGDLSRVQPPSSSFTTPFVHAISPGIITSAPERPPRLNQSASSCDDLSSRERPISTIQFGDPRMPYSSTFVPRSGLDILYGIPSVHIELNLDLFAATRSASENKFTIRSATGEALYFATESSTKRDRLIWGSKRPFSLSLMDKTHKEAVLLRRMFRIGMYAMQPQCVEMWTPPGDFVGYVREKISIYGVDFEILDRSGELVGNVKGPPKVMCSCGMKEIFLKVLSADYAVQLGTITRIWNTDISTFTQNVYFSDPCMEVQLKALLVGVAFLTEYMFFH